MGRHPVIVGLGSFRAARSSPNLIRGGKIPLNSQHLQTSTFTASLQTPFTYEISFLVGLTVLELKEGSKIAAG